MRARPAHGSARKRRGVVLILILAMLGLLALIGVTFATFSGQAQVGARYAAQAVNNTSPDQFIDFGLDQLINDSSNPKSAIRGHSLLRDMYGRDFFVDPIDGLAKAYQNHMLRGLPEPNGQPLTVTGVTQAPSSAYIITTNIPTDNNTGAIRQMPSLYGANFTGNVLRLQQWLLDTTNNRFTPVRQVQRPDRLAQTFEVVADKRSGPFHILTLTFADLASTPTTVTAAPVDPYAFVQPEAFGSVTPPPNFTVPAGQRLADIFEIDGRYMRAFNGTGQDFFRVNDDWTNATLMQRGYGAFGNFLYNRAYNRNAGTQSSFADPNAPTYETGLNDPNFPSATYAQLDEDYDAADNENWFLALRSADGQIVIPSFHRPGNIIYNPNNAAQNDWNSVTLASRSKFLRPRKVDHPLSGDSFPDLIPDATTGKITYDVDNDGDGVTDSVWVDLGYPVRTDASGRKFKPLFAFMVTGLNGRLPLNTAGNLSKRSPGPQPFTDVVVNGTPYNAMTTPPAYIIPAGAIPRVQNGTAITKAPDHTSHLGTSPSEINPKYALTPTGSPAPMGGQPYLQIMLQGNPFAAPAPPVEGRWGEVGIIAATRSFPPELRLFPRPGRSYWPNDVTQRYDEFDTNFDALDFYPKEDALGPEKRDLLDAANRTLLPSERLRRFVLPVDLSGNGRMVAFDQTYNGAFDWGTGYDAQGRVGYHLYYRPPGISNWSSDGVDPLDYTTNILNKLHGYEAQRNPDGANRDIMAGMPSDVGGDPAAVPPLPPGRTMPSFSAVINSSDPVFDPTTGAIDNSRTVGMLPDGSLGLSDPSQMNLYDRDSLDAAFGVADQEWLDRANDIDDSGLTTRLRTLLPDIFVNDTRASTKRRMFSVETWELGAAAAPVNSLGVFFGTANANTILSDGLPLRFSNVSTIPALAHGGRRFNINLPLPPSDLSDEPVRQKYVRELYHLFKSVLAPPDGASLTALQLAELGQYAVNVVDFRDPDATMTRFVNWDLTYQAPVSASIDPTIAKAAPQAAPIPVITMPASVMKPTGVNNNPVEQWGMEYNPVALSEILAYQFTRWDTTTSTDKTTPRLFVELVNTLTEDHGANGTGTAADLTLPGWGFIITQDDPTLAQTTGTTARVERPNVATGQLSTSTINDHFVPLAGTGVGTTATFDPAGLARTVKAIDQTGSGGSGTAVVVGGAVTSITVTAGGTGYSVPPKVLISGGGGTGASYTATVAAGAITGFVQVSAGSGYTSTPTVSIIAAPTVRYYTMTNYINGTNASTSPPTPPIETPLNGPGAVAPNFTIDGQISDDLIKQIPLAAIPPPVPVAVAKSEFYWIHLLRPANPNAGTAAYAVYIAANPTDTVGATNAAANALAAEPKIVVDSFRFPYHVATGGIDKSDANNTVVTRDTKVIYSVKRRQPFRGGHFVPRADQFTPANPYGYTEQTFPSTNATTLVGNYTGKSMGVDTAMPITGPIFHSFDAPGSGTDNWDHFAFHDRDFQSLAELFLVPACPPGLFTKQFVEQGDPTNFDPAAATRGDLPPPSADAPAVPSTRYYYNPWFQQDSAPLGANPSPVPNSPPSAATYATAYRGAAGSTVPTASDWGGEVRGARGIPDPPAFPYLSESFFYSSGTKNGWYKVLEFLEVPSNSLGYIGPVAAGQNADWARRDLRSGLLNLNLITDEEVFFGLIDDPRLNQLNITATNANFAPPSVNSDNTIPYGVAGYPQMATAIYPNGVPSYTVTMNSPGFNNGVGVGMKWAFADFLKLRDGGSGLIYSPFSAATPAWGPSASTIALPSKPFRSLASADINDTVMRPARLAAIQAVNNPPIPDVDPAKNIVGYMDMGVYPEWPTPRTAPRSIFQIPDADPNAIFGTTVSEDLASETNTHPRNLTAMPPDKGGLVLPYPDNTAATPAQDHLFLANPNASLFFNTPYGPMPTGPRGYLGASTDPAAMTPVVDHRWHPAYRHEMLSKVMNNTTVRTHQYAVWMTVGFFEVVKEGNPQMADVRYPATDPNFPNVSLGIDQLGPELNAAAGKATRYRSYFIIDRSRATGFNPSEPGGFRDLVLFRRRIE